MENFIFCAAYYESNLNIITHKQIFKKIKNSYLESLDLFPLALLSSKKCKTGIWKLSKVQQQK